MKNRILYALLALVIFASGCEKTEFDEDIKGEALGTFTITAPENNTMLVLNSATPNAKVNIVWTAAKPGVTAAATYKFVAALKTGSIDVPLFELPSDNNGTATQLTLTQKQLDDLLKGKAIAEGVKTDLIWTIIADNGNVKVKIDPLRNISITRMGDGVSNFLLYGPVSSVVPIDINPGSTTDLLTFKWQKSFPGKTGSAVTYKIKFITAGGNFNSPLFEYTSNNSGVDSTFTISYKDMDLALTAAGFADQATPAVLQWSVEATSGTYKKFSDYTNDVSIKREVKIFLVGGDTPASWTAENALPMIADAANPGTFYIYVKLNAGNGGLKFLNQQQWPGGSLNAADWGMKSGSPGDAAVDNEANIENYGPSGVYRVTFDLKNLKYYIQTGQMGAVGAATAGGWNPPNVFPSQGLTLISPNKFMGFVTLTAANEWKMIDGDSWGSGGGPVNQSRDYGKGATAGVMLETNEDNFTVPGATGSYRIIWDGSDIKNLKYSISTGTVYLIGAATAGGWDNTSAALPAMVNQGNGVWKVTANLNVGEFKFLLQKGSWEYDYGMGATAGTALEKGANLNITTAGSYTVTLDEFNKTYTIVKN